MRTAATVVLSTVLLAGCASQGISKAPERRGARLSVPFFPDATDQCGPSALAAVLGFYGKPATPAELRGEIYRAKLKGALTVDMMLAAQRRGLVVETANGSLDSVKTELDAGRPVLAFVNVGLRIYPVGHYLVITGYDDERRVLFAHSGKKRDRPISYAAFDKQWEKTNRWTLAIMPPS